MRIEIKSRGVDVDTELREYVHRRAAFALSRFGDDVREVLVTLEDVNGPRGGIDQLCKLVVTLRRVDEPVVCETTDKEMQAAIDIAFGRASRTVARNMDRIVDRRRSALR